MPRYFLTTASERLTVRDDEGIEAPHTAALNKMVCAVLADMFKAEAHIRPRQGFSVYASDEHGNEVLKATLRLTVQSIQGP